MPELGARVGRPSWAMLSQNGCGLAETREGSELPARWIETGEPRRVRCRPAVRGGMVAPSSGRTRHQPTGDAGFDQRFGIRTAFGLDRIPLLGSGSLLGGLLAGGLRVAVEKHHESGAGLSVLQPSLAREQAVGPVLFSSFGR